MKKYFSLGELLVDYRAFAGLSQADFAARLDVDPRTVQRWEKDDTLIKQDKEKDIVIETLFPYQVIRNLNAPVPIPTYYDFKIRKYALNEIDCEVPDADWFKDQLDQDTDRIRSINFEEDFHYLDRYMEFYKDMPNNLLQVVRESVQRVPQVNNIIFDDSGYYAGHSIVFPITKEAHDKIMNKEMTEQDLTLQDMVDYKTQNTPVFFNFDLMADCNDNMYFLVNRLINFLQSLPDQKYINAACSIREDTFDLITKAGIKVIWSGEEVTNSWGHRFTKRFHTGNYNDFLNS